MSTGNPPNLRLGKYIYASDGQITNQIKSNNVTTKISIFTNVSTLLVAVMSM